MDNQKESDSKVSAGNTIDDMLKIDTSVPADSFI